MNTEEKKKIVQDELSKTHHFGEALREEHVGNTSLNAVWTGRDKTIQGGIEFPFAAEVELLTEFSTRFYWYYGVMRVIDGSAEPEVHLRKESGVSGFIASRKEDQKVIEKIRKKLNLHQ